MLRLEQSELKKLFEAGMSNIWQYKTLYQINYSKNAGFYLTKIHTNPKTGIGVTPRGRFLPCNINLAIQYSE